MKHFFTKSFILTAITVSPYFAVAAGSFITCDGVTVPCDFAAFMELVNKVATFFLVDFVTPFAAILFAYIGWLFMTSGDNSGNRTKAKEMLRKLFLGYLVALGAWLIVRTIMVELGYRSDLFDAFYNS